MKIYWLKNQNQNPLMNIEIFLSWKVITHQLLNEEAKRTDGKYRESLNPIPIPEVSGPTLNHGW